MTFSSAGGRAGAGAANARQRGPAAKTGTVIFLLQKPPEPGAALGFGPAIGVLRSGKALHRNRNRDRLGVGLREGEYHMAVLAGVEPGLQFGIQRDFGHAARSGADAIGNDAVGIATQG